MEYQDTLKDMSAEDIVKQQASSIENMKRDVNYIAALLRTQAGRIGETVVMETLARTTGKSLAELEKEFSKFTQGQTEDIKTLRDKFVQQTTELIGSAKSNFNKVSEDNKKTSNQNNQNKPTTPPVVNVQTKVEDSKKDINKGPVDDSGKAIVELNKNINQTTTPTQQTQTNPNLKTNEQKNENNKFLSDFEKTYGSINKDNEKPLTLNFNTEKPLNVNIADESITKLTKNDVKPSLNEPKNVSSDISNNLMGEFEKKYGLINKGNEQNPIVKVNPQSIETQKNIDIEKVISTQNQNNLVNNTNQQKTNTEENKSVATVVHKHVVEMNVSSTGPIVDVLARAMLKDPTIVSQFVERDVREFV
jgi:hypothetical protein